MLEEAKKNTADFIGKDDYKGEKMLKIWVDLHCFFEIDAFVLTPLISTAVGDITKEIDSRVKVSMSIFLETFLL